MPPMAWVAGGEEVGGDGQNVVDERDRVGSDRGVLAGDRDLDGRDVHELGSVIPSG